MAAAVSRAAKDGLSRLTRAAFPGLRRVHPMASMATMGRHSASEAQEPVYRVSIKPLVATSPAVLKDYVDLSHAPADFDPANLLVIPDFISQEQHDRLFDAAAKKVRRIAGRHYEKGHFDRVITNYRECTVSSWGSGSGQDLMDPAKTHPLASEDPETLDILRKVYALFPPETRFLAPHLLDLHEGDGDIGAHVDHVSASGGLVCGICLGSEAVAVFRPVGVPREESAPHVKVLLPPRTFYAQVGDLRYLYTHEVPADSWRTFRGRDIPKNRRITVLFRDEYL